MSKTLIKHISLHFLVITGLIIIICPISASEYITDLKTNTSNIHFPHFLNKYEVYQQFQVTQLVDRQRSRFDLVSRTDYEDLLQAALDNAAEEQGLMGISAVVKHPIGGTWIGTTGFSHDDVLIDPDMIFGVASITKTFVAALILLLVEDGFFQLDDPISDWLPTDEYDNIDASITIRQLLNHTSGLYNFIQSTPTICFPSPIMDDFEYFWTPEELMGSCVGQPYFEPGTGYAYSNTNFILAGMIIESATGSQLHIELRNRIIEPLNLDRTCLGAYEELIEPIAHPWEDVDGDGFLDDLALPPWIPWTSLISAMWAYGGMFSTASDISHWTDLLHSGDVLSEESLANMYELVPWANYGLGMRHWVSNGYDAYGHTGGNAGTKSITGYVPDESVTITALINTNTANQYPIFSDLLEVILNYEWQILGDINEDGILDILDVVQEVQCILGEQTENCEYGDVNDDGIVNVLDIVIMVNMILDA
ncbi:MAG: serine hydrolase [Candidatus Marinimicrobia bacterium]|nr:serine hydrolase [Candidatus Neomarinimicrobiota bacterium]